MSDIFEEFDQMFDIKSINEQVKESEQNNTKKGDFEKVPYGDYEVKIQKMELKKAKSTGNPMLSVWFKILAGTKKGSLIFMNQVICVKDAGEKTNKFLLSKGRHFVESLIKEVDDKPVVSFDSFKEINESILNVMENIDGKCEYALKYSENKGYDNFEIMQTYKLV